MLQDFLRKLRIWKGKRLELVGELLGRFSRVVIFSNPTNPYCIVAVESARLAAAALRVQLDVVEISKDSDLDGAFLKVRSIRPDAISCRRPTSRKP